MGRGVAQDLLSKGWNVCICDLNPPAGEPLQPSDNVLFQATDVTDYDALAAAFVAAWTKWKRLDFGRPPCSSQEVDQDWRKAERR
jgi:NAD(P)-dependent dehydrogenase (short-subunit alcohol dehydrogenase family)